MKDKLKRMDAYASDWLRAAVERIEAAPTPKTFDDRVLVAEPYDGPLYSGDLAGRAHLAPEVDDEHG